MIRVLVADDHPLVRLSLEAVLDDHADLVHCGSADRGDTAVALARETDADVVLMDLSMPGLDGISATRQILESRPTTRVLMLTWHTEADLVSQALDAGVTAYLIKDVETSELLAAIRNTTADSQVDSRIA
ncbi:response regulator transcription factor [Lapillicoccus sp.]|uniref:response regulator n=1 Tax=Lapillicoccus sp. TaxID=1909287 RepID=UPI0039833A6D